MAHIYKDLPQSSGWMEITWDWDPKGLDCNPTSHGTDSKNPLTLLCLCDWEDGVIFLVYGFPSFWAYFRKFSRRWLKHLGASCALPDKLVQGKCPHILLLYFLGSSLPMLFFPARSGPPALSALTCPGTRSTLLVLFHPLAIGGDFAALSASLLFVFSDYVSRLSVGMQVKTPADNPW